MSSPLHKLQSATDSKDMALLVHCQHSAVSHRWPTYLQHAFGPPVPKQTWSTSGTDTAGFPPFVKGMAPIWHKCGPHVAMYTQVPTTRLASGPDENGDCGPELGWNRFAVCTK